jgi:ribosomal protein L22
VSSISNISSSYLQSILSNALQGTGLTTDPTGNSLGGIGTSSVALQPDGQQLSPFAQMMSTLQQLQHSDPTKYSQVTQQIATNLQSAAQTAQSDGNTSAANQLNQLAADFSNASKSGQLPNIQDLAQAVGGHHHHHHGHHASADADSNSSSSNSSSSSTNQTLSQFLSALQANGTQNDALNPATIIVNTLSNAGISVSNS